MLNSETTDTRATTVPSDAYRKLLDVGGLLFADELRANKEIYARHFAQHEDALEAYATSAEWDGTAAECAERIQSALPNFSPKLKRLAYAHLGRLLVLSGSRANASSMLADAEALSAEPALLRRIARDRAFLAMTERRWSEAILVLTRLEAACQEAGQELFAMEAAAYRAVALVGNGESLEAIDLLVGRQGSVPEGGVLALRVRWTLARAHVDRIELDQAVELLEQVRPFATPAMFESYARFLHAESEVALWRLDFDGARVCLERLRDASKERALPFYEAHALYALALLEFDAERYGESVLYAEEAIKLGTTLGHTALVAATSLVRVASLAVRGDLSEARKLYRAIRRPHIEGVDASYFDGMSALAEILLANLVGSDEEAHTFDALAQERIAELMKRNRLGMRNIESNFHLHMVGRRLQRFAPLRGLDAPLVQRVQPVSVDLEGRYIEFSNGERVSIEQRPVLRRLLERLAAASKVSPRTPVPPQELIAATWPNDRAQDASLRVRLRVAVATLRQLGLDEALHTKHGGYYLSL